MNYNISFKERAKLAMENLSKQSPVSYEKAIQQVQRLKEMSQTNQKKRRDWYIIFPFRSAVTTDLTEILTYFRKQIYGFIWQIIQEAN